MFKTILLLIFSLFCTYAIAQKGTVTDSTKIMIELAESACKCIDSIDTYNRSKVEIGKNISSCIGDKTTVFQLGSKLSKIEDTTSKEKKTINISIDPDEGSNEYKRYYYVLERYMMQNCKSLLNKIATTDKIGENSFSENEIAMQYYRNGLDSSKKEDHKTAANFYEQAVKEDPKFVFAWDKLGISYRKLNELDKALNAYNSSLAIDPAGTMPLQNIAVVYVYKKDFPNAVKAYEKLAVVDPDNPEVHYGLGNIYTNHMIDLEKGLVHLCKAYNIYVQQKSPYRTDAETLINVIFNEMKKQGKEKQFNDILRSNNIIR